MSISDPASVPKSPGEGKRVLRTRLDPGIEKEDGDSADGEPWLQEGNRAFCPQIASMSHLILKTTPLSIITPILLMKPF